MKLFDHYVFKMLIVSTLIVTAVLSAVIFLSQSLRFLELVMNAGASSGTFWMLTLLALPRFFEIIIPIALMASVVFVYNKLLMDNEIVIMRASGQSPLLIARPALTLSVLVAIILWFITTWAAPSSLAQMHHLRQLVQTQFSSLLFREGVFTSIDDGLTVFVDKKTKSNELEGIILHDARQKNKPPVTIMASRGAIITENNSAQVIVYNGTRQDINPKTGALNRLDFNRYTIDLPNESGPVTQRWQEPDERGFMELFRPDPNNVRDQNSHRDFFVEIHRRLVTPLLAPAFTALTLVFLLLGPTNRRSQEWRIALAVLSTVIIESLFLGAYNLSRANNIGLALMYILTIVPLFSGLLFLSPQSEKIRRLMLFKRTQAS